MSSSFQGMRVVHLPRNIAADPQRTVEAERALGASARLLTIDGSGVGNAPDEDLRLPNVNMLARHARRICRGVRAIRDADLVVFEYNSSALDYPRLGLNLIDMRWARRSGARISAVVFHGSDLRPLDPAWHDVYQQLGVDVNRTRKRLAIARRSADLLYVKTPDLLHLVPESRWLPQAVAVGKTCQSPVREQGDVFIVAHAPTNQALKGTNALIEACRSLRARGVRVHLDLVEGVPHAEVLHRFAGADLVVDQLLVGWYGVTAIEAMALGKPVLCHIVKDLPELAGEKPPVISARPESVERILSDAIAGRIELGALAAAGPAYVERVHAPERVAARLLGDAARLLGDRR